MTSFNLIDEPWIPVLTTAGSQETVSIATLFAKSDHYTQIAAELATVSVAIQRLLQAIVLRAVQPLPRSHDDRVDIWEQWWESKSLPGSELTTYLDRWHDRFDLFHPTTPFFQVPGLALKSGSGSGLDKIIADVPSGTKFFTVRTGQGLERISFAEAAAWVVHAQAFDCAGIKSGVLNDARVKGGRNYSFGYPAWAGNLGIISLEGSTLTETLLLNLDLTSTSQEDAPVWETAPQRIASDGIYPVPLGAAQSWTWPSRMIRLIPDGESVVDVVLSNGERLEPHNRYSVEPMVSWKYSDNQSKKLARDIFMPVTHDPARAAWRGLAGVLAQSPASDTSRRDPAGVLKWVSTLKEYEILPDDYQLQLRCVGMNYGPQASTYSSVFNDTVDIRAAALTSPALRSTAVEAVEAARRAVFVLRNFAKNLAWASGDSGDDVAAKIQDLETDAYAELRAPYQRWLDSLTNEGQAQAAAKSWEQTVSQTIRNAIERHARQCSPAAALGRTVRIHDKDVHMDLGRALQWCNAALRKALPLAHPISPKEGSDEDNNGPTDQ